MERLRSLLVILFLLKIRLSRSDHAAEYIYIYVYCERRVFIFVSVGYFLESTVIPLISFFVGSCLFKGMYHGPFLFFLFLSLSLFCTSGFADAGASETQRLDFYTRFLLQK